MTRQKIKLAYIINDSARKATYKKRKKGLLKKVNELSTLCGVDACAIVYSAYEAEPETWPPTAIGVQRVLAQFRRMPEMEQSKKMVNQESFLKQRITKSKEQLKKLLKDNREKEMTEIMYQCLTGKSMANLSLLDLNDLAWLIDQNLREIKSRMDKLQKLEGNAGQTGGGGGADLVMEDTKPLLEAHSVVPTGVNPTPTSASPGTFPVQGMQTSATAWFSSFINGTNHNNHGASSSNNNQLMVLPGMNAGVMMASQNNMGGVWPSHGNYYNA